LLEATGLQYKYLLLDGRAPLSLHFLPPRNVQRYVPHGFAESICSPAYY
jgi:hypothetical protein